MTARHVIVATALAATTFMHEGRAQSWLVEESVDAMATVTSNGDQSPDAEKRADVVGSVKPAIRVTRHGPGLDLDVRAGAELLAFARGTQQNRILPFVRSSLVATLMDRLLFLDAALDVSQVEANPYAGRVADTQTNNRRNRLSYSVSPYLLRQLSSGTSVLARQDEFGLRESNGGGELRSHRTTLLLEALPAPLGYAVEASRLRVESTSDSADGVPVPFAQADADLAIDTLKVRANALVAGELIIGPMVGTERVHLADARSTDTIYGVRALWEPSTRTRMLFELEHHFFGLGGEISARHRTPSMSFLLRATRAPDATGGNLNANGMDLAGFLDAIMTTRQPDATQRASAVQNIVNLRGLQTSLPQASNAVAGYAQVRTNVEGAWVLLGGRNTLSVSAFAQQRRQVRGDLDAGSAAVAGALSDDRQYGASVEFNRRLTPRLAMDVSARWATIRGIGERTGDRSSDHSVRLAFVQEVAPRTSITAGVQQRRVSTNVSSLSSYGEVLVFAGVQHRF